MQMASWLGFDGCMVLSPPQTCSMRKITTFLIGRILTSIFATYHPSWADVCILLNIMLTGDERRMVIDKAREEVY